MILSDTSRVDLIILLVGADKPYEYYLEPVLHRDDDAIFAAPDIEYDAVVRYKACVAIISLHVRG